jgi:pimeloyl-ACP methyl ester carboxylesterase
MVERDDSDFMSHGLRCAGWLCLPKGVSKPPVVVMAHGFAAERTFGLMAFAEVFVRQGIAAFVFDYRCFGDSQGEPRNLVSPRRHLEDWAAALSHVRGLKAIDTARVALWGTSFSGGHVIVTAARDRRVSAVVAQVPFVGGLASAGTLGSAYILKALAAGLRDAVRMATQQPPYTVPVVGDPQTFAVMNTPGSKEGYLSLVPKGSSWQNQCPARILLSTMAYRPDAYARKVACPALVLAAEKDSLIPVAAVERMVRKMPKATLVRLPVGHFDVYTGETFRDAVEREAAFLKTALRS